MAEEGGRGPRRGFVCLFNQEYTECDCQLLLTATSQRESCILGHHSNTEKHFVNTKTLLHVYEIAVVTAQFPQPSSGVKLMIGFFGKYWTCWVSSGNPFIWSQRCHL